MVILEVYHNQAMQSYSILFSFWYVLYFDFGWKLATSYIWYYTIHSVVFSIIFKISL